MVIIYLCFVILLRKIDSLDFNFNRIWLNLVLTKSSTCYKNVTEISILLVIYNEPIMIHGRLLSVFGYFFKYLTK